MFLLYPRCSIYLRQNRNVNFYEASLIIFFFLLILLLADRHSTIWHIPYSVLSNRYTYINKGVLCVCRMSFADFASTFTSLELVHVGPDDWLRERALHAKRPWRAVLARRRWRTGYNAGGPPSCTGETPTPCQHLSSRCPSLPAFLPSFAPIAVRSLARTSSLTTSRLSFLGRSHLASRCHTTTPYKSSTSKQSCA